MEKEPLLNLILDRLNEIVDYRQAIIAQVEAQTQDEKLTVLAYHRPVCIEEEMMARLVGEKSFPDEQPDTQPRKLSFIPPLVEDTPLAHAAQSLVDEYQQTMPTNADSWLVVPLVFKEEIMGMLLFSYHSSSPFPPQSLKLVLALANYTALALRNERLYEQTRALAILQERNRLAQELHDNLAQMLGYLKLKIFTISSLLAEGQQAEVQANLQELKQLIGETYTDVREEIFNLRAKVSSGMSFLEMLRRYIAKYKKYYNLDIQLTIEMNESQLEFPTDVGQQVIRIIQEALVNVRKHAGVNQAQLRFRQEGQQICISIIDNGQGFEATQAKQDSRTGFGLQIMQERAESINGTLEIKPMPGQGVEINLQLPVFG